MLKTIEGLYSKTYVGYTNDINKRLEKHNSNKGAKATKGYKWKVIYKRKFLSKSKALSYEYKLKKDTIKRSLILKKYEQQN
jgi:putative endonuclease|tara:strand:- start:2470 stop:2712 length:243 start_codon:yes stop_codon:yes gene_type:complete